MKEKWSNSDLLEFFDTYNEKFFGGKLPRLVCLKFAPLDALGHTYPFRSLYPRRKLSGWGITISDSSKSSRRVWAQTLLHEMVHLEQECWFSCSLRSRRFNQRMTELAQAGAFNGIW